MKESLAKYIALFDQYLDGNLSLDAIHGLEEALTLYPNLARALEEHIDARRALRVEGEQQLKASFKHRLEERDKRRKNNIEQKKASRVIPLYLKMVSSLLILIGCAVFFTQIVNKDKEIESFEDPSISYFRGNDSDVAEDDWKELLHLFSEKAYDEFLDRLANHPIESSIIKKHYGQYHLTHGVSYYRTEQYNLADKTLQKIPSDNAYYDQALWFRILNAKASGNQDLFKELLQLVIKTPDHYHHKTAKKWLTKK